MSKQHQAEAPEKAKMSGDCRDASPDSTQLFQGAISPISQLQRTLGSMGVRLDC